MKKIDLLILSWHQTYLSTHAGGYVRLREFLKRIPGNLSFRLLDNSPSIYQDLVKEKDLILYQTPAFIKPIQKFFFPLWYLLENLTSGLILYKKIRKIMQTSEVKVLYVPIAEFRHLYLPAYFLKKRFKHTKLVVDILNYEIPDKSAFEYFQKLRKTGRGIISSVAIVLDCLSAKFVLSRTIKLADYVFTVSPELVEKINQSYQKKTIAYTPSGVNIEQNQKQVKKKYLGVYIGRMTLQKGIFDVLRTWKLVVQKQPSAKLALAGQVDPNTLETVHKTVRGLGLEKLVTVFGQVTEENKNKILSESELFLHLASYEPLFPVIGILEGSSFGLPAVIYDMDVVASQKKELTKRNSVYIVRNGNIGEAAKKVLAYSKAGNAEKKALSKDARYYASLFDWDLIAKKEWTVIVDLASGQRLNKNAND